MAVRNAKIPLSSKCNLAKSARKLPAMSVLLKPHRAGCRKTTHGAYIWNGYRETQRYVIYLPNALRNVKYPIANVSRKHPASAQLALRRTMG